MKARLADLHAANFVTDIVAGRPREFVGDRTGQVAIDLAEWISAYVLFKPQ